MVGILREVKGGMTTKAVCAQHNISEQTFYNWKKKYQRIEVNDVRSMRAMAEEISRFKRIVVDQVVQIDILKAGNAKKSKPFDQEEGGDFDRASGSGGKAPACRTLALPSTAAT